jgi:hypothetical protein
MGKIIKFECDGCGEEPNANKNFLMVSGMLYKFTKDGPQKLVLEQYFCDKCSEQLIVVIERLRANKKENV